MTVTYGFYNSLDGDRTYNAVQFAAMFDSLVIDGVFGHVGNRFWVGSSSGMHVIVNTGRAWFKSSWIYNDAVITLDIPTAHPTNNRIDSVVIEIDSSDQVRANAIKVIEGTAAASPVPPTLSHTATLNQYPLAYVLVRAGYTQVYSADITNKVGTSLCPLISGILTTVSIDQLVAQWEAEFEFWFDTLVSELTENQAANLQAQITNANSTLIEEIVSTGTPNEFVFDDIPGGFEKLRITGLLKVTATTGYDGSVPTVRFNDDGTAKYAYLAPNTGQWSGWGSNTALVGLPIVNSATKNASIYSPFELEIPSYDVAAFKWAIWRGHYGAAPNMNPSIDATDWFKRNIWRSTSPITKITISGTYVANISKLRLYGCAN